MKLQFKHQKFQADAAKAVVDVFAGQPYLTSSYMIVKDSEYYQQSFLENPNYTGWCNQKIIPELNDHVILEHLQEIQKRNLIQPSEKLEGKYNLTIEMETGVGKTYTYIKTMYELNKHYGWSKFIVVVPSIAIREGVYKTFEITQEHFAEEYGKKVRFFIYNSAQLTEIEHFASDNSISVMIINAQAFNARGKDARRIYMKLDEFRSRRPIDIIAKTNPILIIDEPQSVEGKQTKENLKQFHPLMTLRYSATHRKDSIYNMVYRLDAVDAYNKCLVKKISVKGIKDCTNIGTEGYVYLESINLSLSAPTATIQFDKKSVDKIQKITRIVSEKYNLYEKSGQLEEYRNGFVITRIDGRDNSVEFINGIKLHAGDVIGRVGEDQLRRIQIRETILSHIERERELFHKGIKVLSLFFIDEVAKYRVYDENGQSVNGIYADMFEEEYNDIIDKLQIRMGEDDYLEYLKAIPAEKTHAGYFSIDKKGKMIDSKVSRKETVSDDVDAYDLIMKNKELLLDRNPDRSPVRFIFSHSALREGWDNPNVFQICTLKQSASETRKRQEVGRGLRLCVNQDGQRMDVNVLGNDVHKVNVLTVIAGESYDSFAKGLQKEIAETVVDRLYMDSEGSDYDSSILMPENARRNNVEVTVDEAKLYMPEFRKLWSGINSRSIYRVNFDSNELVKKSITALDNKLRVSRGYYMVETGEMSQIESKEELEQGEAFTKKKAVNYRKNTDTNLSMKYDLIGKLVDETDLTRKAIVQILQGIQAPVFEQFKHNPEEFIIKAAALINEEKAVVSEEHITYEETGEKYSLDIFTDAAIKGRFGVNAMRVKKHLYDYVIYDSINERTFVEELEANPNVAVYVKLPRTFYISTPIGRYTPDWAIAFYEGTEKHTNYVVETKGSMDSMQLRLIEKAKIHCAREHFKAISGGNVEFEVVDGWESFMEKVMR